MKGESVSSRARWAVAFAAVLLISTAVPVLAAEAPPPAPAGQIAVVPEELDASRLPSGEEVAEAVGKAAREEEEWKAWLASPEAVREREESRFAFADLDRAGAEELLRSAFPEQLAQLNRDPARFLSSMDRAGKECQRCEAV